ncbi:MAG TPA: hypothetical protein VFV66_05145 [Nonomuraea sp.]|nr:hypothetical protein [Nonomuraea sp.]
MGSEAWVKYVLMFIEAEEFANTLEAMGKLERDVAYEAVRRWFAEHADEITVDPRVTAAHTANPLAWRDRRSTSA